MFGFTTHSGIKITETPKLTNICIEILNYFANPTIYIEETFNAEVELHRAAHNLLFPNRPIGSIETPTDNSEQVKAVLKSIDEFEIEKELASGKDKI